MKQKIFSDAYNISKRIKQIDKNYYIAFNLLNSKFQICSLLDDSVVLTLPFNFLDVRTINYLKQHLQKSNEEILKEIDDHNKNYLNSIYKKITLDAISSAERVLKRR